MNNPSAYPLSWPASRPRHEGERRRAASVVSLNRSMAELNDSLHLLASESCIPVRRFIVSSNVSLGEPRPEDPGVAVYFEWDGALRCIAVDEFASVEGNLRAVYAFIDRARAEMRSGGLPMVRAMLAGFRVPEAA